MYKIKKIYIKQNKNEISDITHYSRYNGTNSSQTHR